MEFRLPAKTMDYLLMGIIAGIVAGLILTALLGVTASAMMLTTEKVKIAVLLQKGY